MKRKDSRYREIPYNYTSFSDKEIILNYFDDETWQQIEELRSQRKTGRSAKLLFEIIGDIFIIERNPYLFDDFLDNQSRFTKLKNLHEKRLTAIRKSSESNPLANDLLAKTQKLDHDFFESFGKTKAQRLKVLALLITAVSYKNIKFSPFHRVLHATDATDWRVQYPFMVVYPDSANEIPRLITLAAELGLHIIPRGGGTGLTGGAVPIKQNTMVINTEKLNAISGIEYINESGIEIPVISAEAGVVTDKIIEHCENQGFVFATDPTSAWASTIGGNIAENAGGKKCVMWGTAIDNIYSYTLAAPNGDLVEVKRVNHPYRKIHPGDLVNFEIKRYRNKKEIDTQTIALSGTDIRKKGLGKDITNKKLNGLPGIQKEGGDGIITSARFVLYRPFKYCTTLCVEFFGNNMLNASKAIVAINADYAQNPDVFLTALEHFDEKYVRAINYRNKSYRNEIPKAVLLIDIESDNEAALKAACERTGKIIPPYNAEGTFAKDSKERIVFWNDRKHLGAIAKHTNAFKLNEDVVIPIEKLPEFADFIELLNYEYLFANYLNTMIRLSEWLDVIRKTDNADASVDRLNLFAGTLDNVKADYAGNHAALLALRKNPESRTGSSNTILHQLQNDELKINFEKDVVQKFSSVFHGYDSLLAEFDAITSDEKNRCIIIATHMHAGDGNIHVNIPVHSSDYQMMIEADEAASLAMKEAVRIGGVVSGEHGIGLTKLKFIDKEILNQYQEYKKSADPDNIFNPGKLDSRFPLHSVYTPSFNLLECEAIILESTDLEKLNTNIASCVRCGKCKGVCNTHYPAANMHYNPRNKILAVGLITEAILFSAQTLDMKSFTHFTKLREIADNCTVCHKCQVPCPVKIDFGNVSLNIREQLVHRKKTGLKIFTSAALFYLGRKKYFANKLFRIGLLQWGYTAQRMAATVYKPVSQYISFTLPRAAEMLRTPFPRSGAKSIRETFKLKNPDTFYSFENPDKPILKSVVYFPGCGSERMFPEISMATVAMLYNAGVRIVIPHEFLCCGYPFLANGKTGQADLKSYENRVLFHRIADAAGYMNIDAVVVSCGTCHEMLDKYELQNIFSGAALMDVNEYIAKEGLYASVNPAMQRPLYHQPCHNPLKHFGEDKTFRKLYGNTPVLVPDCCGEAGTLALSRPDITSKMRERKSNNVAEYDKGKDIEILTTCPSCVLGLSKLGNGRKVNGKSLIVFNAENFIGKDWKKQFVHSIKKNGVERIIF
jgi:FAD/FMN-containing dehydrogenase/Fe-S oxidoreductase